MKATWARLAVLLASGLVAFAAGLRTWEATSSLAMVVLPEGRDCRTELELAVGSDLGAWHFWIGPALVACAPSLLGLALGVAWKARKRGG